MVWIGTDDGMDALEWGWKVDNNQMVPIMTDTKASPDNLLKMIHCNCGSCPPHCIVAGDMDYHAMLDADHGKLIYVTTHTTIT